MAETLLSVPVTQCAIRSNYRQEYDSDFVNGIAHDMIEHGFKMNFPIKAYAENGKYFIIDGNTRYTAACLANKYYEARLGRSFHVWIVVSDKPSDKAFILEQLEANEKRVDPDDISKATGYQLAMSQGATIDDLMSATGHNREYVENRLNLLKLVPEAQQLVAKKQLGIKFSAELVKLDTNFQRIAIKAYNTMKSPTLDEFRTVCNELFTKQSQCSLFDLSLFNGQPIESIMAEMKIERKKTRDELEAELEAEKTARQNDRAYAIAKFTKAQQEIARLKAQLMSLQKMERVA